MIVEVKAGRATRRYRVVKSDGPDDLVFQSVQDGRPMRDNNIFDPSYQASRKDAWYGLGQLAGTAEILRHLVTDGGTDPRDRQSLMRHSRFTTTAEVYEQDLPESQLRAVDKLRALVN